MTTAGDQVRVQMFVGVSPEDAFDVFTLEIDQWWGKGPAYRVAGRSPGTLHLEARLGGRIFEAYGEGALHEVGTITTWERPHRLVFEWRSITFAPGETTTVDLTFEPSGRGTRVTLVHRGWAAIRGDHPVRHGKPVGPFIAELGMWWAQLLRALAHISEARGAV